MGELKSISSNSFSVTVRADRREVQVAGRQILSPAQARALAVELLDAADAAQGKNSDIQGFGHEATDGRELTILRLVIAEELGWGSDAEECAKNYTARIVQVGKILRQCRLRSVIP